jgi:hypothetical protein
MAKLAEIHPRWTTYYRSCSSNNHPIITVEIMIGKALIVKQLQNTIYEIATNQVRQ